MEINTTYPGRPNYTGPDSGLAGLVHHDMLFEYCWSFKERLAAIEQKPAHMVETRRHCLVYLDPTGQPWDKAWAAVITARAEVDKCAPQIEAQIRSLIPDLDTYWDGKQLLFPDRRK